VPGRMGMKKPWWRSPLFVVPAVAGATTIATVAVVSAAMRGSNCTDVGPAGGTIAGVPYLERLRGGASPNENLPMVVVLHGLGGTPDGYAGGFGGIGKARLILPQGAYEGGGGFKWWERGLHDITLDEQPGDVEQWRAASLRLSEFIRQVTHCRPTIGRPIITGGSQGGEASLLVATQHRKQVSYAVSVNGDMPPQFWYADMAPTLMLNGTGDTTVPFDWAQAHATAMIERGAPIEFIPFPSTGHAITNAMSQAWIAAIRDRVEQIWQRG
jgi:phospholipase/carboxylesterase